MPGTITFKPVEANLTRNTSRLLGMDPYCLFTVGDTHVQSHVSRRGGKHPHWSDEISVEASQERCRVEIKDSTSVLPDGTIGSFDMDLHEIQTKGNVIKWYPVSYYGQNAGEILIEASFNPENKINLNIDPSVAGSDLSGNLSQDPLKRFQSENLGYQGELPELRNDRAMSSLAELGRIKEQEMKQDIVQDPKEPKPQHDEGDLFHTHHKDRDGLDLTSEIGPHRTGYDKNLWTLPNSLKEMKDLQHGQDVKKDQQQS